MSEPRPRATAWHKAGAVSGTVLFIVVGLASDAIGTWLHWHANRRLITASLAAATAAPVTVVLLVTVAVAHMRRTGSVSGFLTQPVTPQPSAWRQFAVLFLVYAWTFAFIALLLGIVFP